MGKLNSPEEIFQYCQKKADEMNEADKEIDNLLLSLVNVVAERNDIPKDRKERIQRTTWHRIYKLNCKKSDQAWDIFHQLTGENRDKMVWFEANKPVVREMPQQILETIKRLGIILTDGALEEETYIVFPPGSKIHKRRHSNVTQITLPTGKLVKVIKHIEREYGCLIL
jgi:hypothetical protein